MSMLPTNLETKIFNTLAKELQKQIDTEILKGLGVSSKRKIVWREIKRLTLRAEEHNPPWASASISESDMFPVAKWIKETGCGRRTSFDMVKFRSETEMSMFLLRWG